MNVVSESINYINMHKYNKTYVVDWVSYLMYILISQIESI